MPQTRNEVALTWAEICDPDAHGVHDDEADKMFHGLADDIIEAYVNGECFCCKNNRPSGRCP